VVLCDDILKRSKVIEQNLSELDDEKSKGKEVSKDEFIR
jgi:hypothetical protein